MTYLNRRIYPIYISDKRRMAVHLRSRIPCPISKIYDSRHIRQIGYNCPYKHQKYNWPSRIKASTTIIGDSIPKYIKGCYEIFVQSCPGLTLNRLLYQIKMGKMATTNFRLIILHCGTNDVHSKTDEEILDLISETIIAIRQKNFVCKIAVSAIIQRLCDDEGPRLQS